MSPTQPSEQRGHKCIIGCPQHSPVKDLLCRPHCHCHDRAQGRQVCTSDVTSCIHCRPEPSEQRECRCFCHWPAGSEPKNVDHKCEHCFPETSPEQKTSRTILFFGGRANGKQIDALMMFIENGRKGEKTVYATLEGNFLSPAMVEIEKAKSYEAGQRDKVVEVREQVENFKYEGTPAPHTDERYYNDTLDDVLVSLPALKPPPKENLK